MNIVEQILGSALGTPAPEPIAKSRHETRAQFSITLLQHLRHSGFGLLVTAHEAHHIAARYGVKAGERGDHITTVSLASVCKKIAAAV